MARKQFSKFFLILERAEHQLLGELLYDSKLRRRYSTQSTTPHRSIPNHLSVTGMVPFRDGKEPSLLWFGSVRVLTKVRVRFGSSSSQMQKMWVRFLYSQF